ncbi:thiamine pyrophosphate-dependent enzyme [Streptomyces caniscabiei]|nr:1-deoxy-D-xylulose-5-phosphate synthase N-terminal domain-containing protein [Streptomyces caniscabiei]MDX3511892.1 thiamine pyrophosphate-dependent enzyme [Streptomyces caniscabiei]MDX3719054.1 thiamine pyrophosphate-dependent enzyme [Streptomyces caniscabiei]MDX3725860.1 thiamine pyrophosphate-dependent enzyme [Streptomyces caniscabiei]WEO26794.1 thiamine pyrophosphate-dependent enzyme [Streptomyces caniscabiei]
MTTAVLDALRTGDDDPTEPVTRPAPTAPAAPMDPAARTDRTAPADPTDPAALAAPTDPAVLVATLAARAVEARRLVVDMAASPRGCHLGGSLSVLDILIAALHRASAGDGTEVVLSKGHAAAGLYAALHVSGALPENPAPLYGLAGHPYTGHPGPKVPGVRFPTGSLGHGVPYAAGWALSERLRGRHGLGIAVAGDGELQEGLVWETCQVAAAQELGNFVLVVDRNGGQNDGMVADISPLPRLADRFTAFGFDVTEVDGHDLGALTALLAEDRTAARRPLAVVADTVKGKGVRAVEGKAACHYVTIDQARAAKWKRAIR